MLPMCHGWMAALSTYDLMRIIYIATRAALSRAALLCCMKSMYIIGADYLRKVPQAWKKQYATAAAHPQGGSVCTPPRREECAEYTVARRAGGYILRLPKTIWPAASHLPTPGHPPPRLSKDRRRTAPDGGGWTPGGHQCQRQANGVSAPTGSAGCSDAGKAAAMWQRR